MKILTGIDVPFQPFGGSVICADDWYSNAPDGVDVRFLTLPNPPTKKWWSMKDVVMLDIQKPTSPDGFHDYVAKLTTNVQEQIETYKPDVIHCQHLNYGLSRAFANIDMQVPRIGICHGTDVQSALTDPIFMDNLHVICDAMDLLVFPNQNMHEDFQAIYAKPKPYVINPLGIPEHIFNQPHRSRRFDGGGQLRILYAGRLLEWKGPDIAVDAMALVKHDIHLTVVGNEDQHGYMTRLEQSVQQKSLQGQVTFVRQLPRMDLVRQFGQYDVIVFPSRRLEAFSLTVVEAQANGLPVVYNPGGGIANTVGASGLALSHCTPDNLAQILDYLYENPNVLQELKAKGYKNAAKYKLSASRERLFELSEELIVASRTTAKIPG